GADADGIPAARVPAAPARPGLHAGAAHGRGHRRRRRRPGADDRRPHQDAAPQARRAGPDRDGPRRRLPLPRVARLETAVPAPSARGGGPSRALGAGKWVVPQSDALGRFTAAARGLAAYRRPAGGAARPARPRRASSPTPPASPGPSAAATPAARPRRPP